MVSRYLSGIFLASLAAASISVEARGSYVGREMPPTPDGCSSLEGMVLGSSDSFAYERLICSGSEIVLLQRFKERRGKRAYWEVIDELHVPASTARKQTLAVPLCSSRIHPNDAILAIGRWTTAKDGSFVAKDISSAWRFNVAKGKIEAISTQGITCEGDNPD